tara:strand:+ start:461 stop:922 length:462 start_codon:yes stop_codon:yes gene_type:complete
MKVNNSNLHLKKPNELNTYQLNQLNTLLDECDTHDEYSGSNLVKGNEYDLRRIVFVLDNSVVGFMTPRQDSRFDNRWRTGAIFVTANFRGMGIAPMAIKKFFKNKKGYSWISNLNKASQNAFTSAGFVKGEERNSTNSSSPLPFEKGYNWYKN